jgi:hypothetical protein
MQCTTWVHFAKYPSSQTILVLWVICFFNNSQAEMFPYLKDIWKHHLHCNIIEVCCIHFPSDHHLDSEGFWLGKTTPHPLVHGNSFHFLRKSLCCVYSISMSNLLNPKKVPKHHELGTLGYLFRLPDLILSFFFKALLIVQRSFIVLFPYKYVMYSSHIHPSITLSYPLCPLLYNGNRVHYSIFIMHII